MAMDFDTVVAALVSAFRECQEQNLIPTLAEMTETRCHFAGIATSLASIADSLEALVEIVAELEANSR